MKKFLAYFSSTIISFSALNPIVSCGVNKNESYSKWITGFDVVSYTKEFVRDKGRKWDLSSTSSDAIITIKNINEDELLFIRFTDKMSVMWAYQDQNSLLFGANNLYEYKTWDYIMPLNSVLAKNKGSQNFFSDKTYKYFVMAISRQTSLGEILQLKNQLNESYSLAINVDDLNSQGYFNIDASLLGNDKENVYNFSKKETLGDQISWTLANNAVDSNNSNIRLLGRCIQSLAENKSIEFDISKIFTFEYTDTNGNIIDEPKRQGEYIVECTINETIVKTLLKSPSITNTAKIKFKLV